MRLDISIIILSASAKKRDRLLAMIQAYGWRTSLCSEPFEVYQQLRAGGSVAAQPQLLILTDMDANSRAVLAYVRALLPETEVLLVSGEGTEQDLISSFQLGIDLWVPETASAELLIAMLLRMANRQMILQSRMIGSASPEEPPPVDETPVAESPKWVLDEKGWRLISPDGTALPLTTGERKLLLTLISAPEKKVSRERLIQILHGIPEDQTTLKDHGRLGVLVSRLRRKAETHGLVLPLKSLYNWGYMFTG